MNKIKSLKSKMGKKSKRLASKRARLQKYFDLSMGTVTKRCSNCKEMVTIPPIDSWSRCSCGKDVSRFEKGR